MRLVPLIISSLITIALVVVLNVQLPVGEGKTPKLGYFLSPQKGFWQNAEAVNAKFNGSLHFDGLQGKTEVYFDERLVPHVFADNSADAFFVQGYLHAKFRLWQMEFQTHAAAGRLSEVMGAKSNGTDFLGIDKFFRRLGMVYGAEQSLKAMEADTETKAALDAYTAGVNSYINSLSEDQYPFEYKLLGYKPEPWTNLKCALFLMYMSYDLTGGGNDFEMTNAKTVFTKDQFEKLYPYAYDTMHPIYPKTTVFPKPAFLPKIPASADSLYFNYKDSVDVGEQPEKPNKNNGSNNWAVDSIKTASGRPILCNDMHLGLNLPSLWYEMQISTPEYNVYGVSFSGAPSIIVGFNDSCAWGLTNAGRDVKDFYEVRFKDRSMKEYWYDSTWRLSTFRDEVIGIKGGTSDTEHIPITVWGPVMYDETYPNKLNTQKAYAIRWTALDSNTALKSFLLLDKAKNFEDYKQAVLYFKCPGQNFAFITKKGDCAMKEQGAFPAKWRRQGDFLMPGDNNDYRWQSLIPDSENIVMNNPHRGFVSSANQMPYDTSYPYYMSSPSFENFRNAVINHNLFEMQNITVEDMKRLQNDTYNLMAALSKPTLLYEIDSSQLNEDDKKFLEIFNEWNLRDDAGERGATIFTIWWDSLKNEVYGDELAQTQLPMPQVEDATLVQALERDSVYEFADNINTEQIENLRDVITSSFKKIIPVLKRAEESNLLAWGKFKDSGVRHLLKLAPLSRLHLNANGGDHVINAYEQYHGPSWRIIVELTDEPNAFGIYPGGQSGNPGSKYYDTFIDDYVAGKYYRLHLYRKEQLQQRNLGKIVFTQS